MPALALDVGSYSIKAIAGKTGSRFRVIKAVEVLNTVRYAVPPDTVKGEQLTQLLSSLVSDYSLPRSDIRLSLPESMVSTKVISIPPLSDAELASAIQWQAERHIPISPDDLALEYQVLYRPKAKEQIPMRVLLVGARKSQLQSYLDIFFEAGLEPTLVETQVISLLRAINFSVHDPATMVVHVGATELVATVVSEGEMKFVVTHSSGVAMLIRAVMETIGLAGEQAEQYVRAYGLDETQFEGKVRSILMPLVEDWLSVMRRSVQFFSNENPGSNVQRVILSGGGANLTGLLPLISQELSCEVLIVSPFATASGLVPEISHPSYTVCAGLLSRD